MERQFAQRLDILNISFAAAGKFMDDATSLVTQAF
jgi:hypothetical protein